MTYARFFRMPSLRSRSSVELRQLSGAAASGGQDVSSGPVVLQKINRPDLQDLRHRESSLKLWVFEAKRLPAGKKRYYCEICLDHILYARTTSKEKTQDADPFWGEPFEFNNLQDVTLVTLRLYREASERKRRKSGSGGSEFLGEVQLEVQDLRAPVERWLSLQPPPGAPHQRQLQQRRQTPPEAAPSLRVRAHFLSVEVLPLACYRGLQDVATRQPLALVAALEPGLQLRAKEDLAARLVSLALAGGTAESLVAGLAMAELDGAPLTAAAAEPLIFRGNSVATKAVEIFLRLTCPAYLRAMLAEPLAALLLRAQQLPDSCEVAPQLVPSAAQLASNQRSLIALAELFWSRVRASAALLPPEVPRLFALVRQRLTEVGRPELGDTVVGASLFLRLICPAILGPSLFGLCQQLPGPGASRALTLVAKAVQKLANGAAFGSKEPQLQFLNRFLDQQGPAMRTFLRAASRPAPNDDRTAAAAAAAAAPATAIDLGFELAQLHAMLPACLATVAKPEPLLQSLASELATVDRCLRGCSSDRPPLAGPPQSQQQQQLQEDWKLVLGEAHSFATANTGSSSGYRSCSINTATTAESPVHFYNPTYQKVGAAAAAAASEDEYEGEGEGEGDEEAPSTAGSSSASSLGSPPPPPPPPQLPTPSRMSRSLLPPSTAEAAAVRQKARSLGPSAKGGAGPGLRGPPADSVGRVRMGTRTRQLQEQLPQQQPLPAPAPAPAPAKASSPASSAPRRAPQSDESELQKLQRELADTRRRLQATEARLRSNESEKAQLMARFVQHHQHQQHQHQHQQEQQMSSSSSVITEAARGQQMQQIMQRLHSLERRLPQRQTNSLTASPVTQGGSCLRNDS